jgi:hypothetical protein
MRTTIDIDAPVLDEVKALQRREGGSLGAIVSRLLADALAMQARKQPPPALHWTSRPMRPLVDLRDKEAVFAALDGDRT